MPVGVARQSALEVVRALCVLALLFLNFGHAQAAPTLPHGTLLTAAVDTSFCGDPAEPPGSHSPCHACRIGSAADLPPEPCAIALPQPLVAAIVRISVHSPLFAIHWHGAIGARAPPAV